MGIDLRAVGQIGKPRVGKKHVRMYIHSAALLTPVYLGEIDNFQRTSKTKASIDRPTGYALEGSTVQYGGWDLSFDGGKVDWALAHFYYLQDRGLIAGKQPPEFFINEIVKHYNGSMENWVYRNVTLFGFDGNTGDGESKESLKGFSPLREIGMVDTGLIFDPIGTFHREMVFNVLYGDTQDKGFEDLGRVR